MAAKKCQSSNTLYIVNSLCLFVKVTCNKSAYYHAQQKFEPILTTYFGKSFFTYTSLKGVKSKQTITKFDTQVYPPKKEVTEM